GRRLFQAATVTIPEANRLAAALAFAQQKPDGPDSSEQAIKKPEAASGQAKAKHYPLESVEGLRFHNVTTEPSVLQGKKGLRATISEETLRRIERTQQNAQGLDAAESLFRDRGPQPLFALKQDRKSTRLNSS